MVSFCSLNDFEKRAVVWMEHVTGQSRGPLSVQDWLQSGQVLCDLVNRIKPGSVQVSRMLAPDNKMQNLKGFIQAAKSLGVPESAMFDPYDLYEKNNISAVVSTIYALAASIRKEIPGYTGPLLRAPTVTLDDGASPSAKPLPHDISEAISILDLDIHEGDAADLKPHHLSSWRSGEHGLVLEQEVNPNVSPLAANWPGINFLNPDELVLGSIITNDSKWLTRDQHLRVGAVRGNACKQIWWKPEEVKAAIVTCGGLCPGLNSIIREVTNTLWDNYGIRHILGMQGGYGGLSNPAENTPVELNPTVVSEIHMKGGSILKAGRGGFEPETICKELQRMGINMVFTVGGDGTQYASFQLFECARKNNVRVSIVGVPKSIDNDIVIFDRTFGFDSAVAKASQVIRNAWVEATSYEKGVGIVKLMGRDAGFVAMNAALASTIVDLVLIPEVSFKMEDVLEYVDATLNAKNFMVIAVAEGAGQDHVSTGEKDATGHTKYGDIGVFLKDTVAAHLKKQGCGDGSVIYIDPSYMIRSCPVTPNDHIYCARLSRDAVHTAMRGYTGVCVGPIHNIIILLPSSLIANKKKRVKVRSSAWQSCIQACKMPYSLSGLNDGH